MNDWIYLNISKYYSSIKDVSVLDCGCGFGTNSLMLARCGAKVSAFDKSPENINNLQEAARRSGLKVQTQVCSVLNFVPDQSFEIVLFNNVLHFIPEKDRQVALDIVIKSVKSNGLLVYSDLADDNPPAEATRAQLCESLYEIDEGFIYFDDSPHLGANYPHKHKVHYLVGRKNST